MSAETAPDKRPDGNKRNRTFLIIAGAIVLVLASWMIWNTFRSSQPHTAATSGSEGISVGDTAPNFRVPTLDGETFTLNDGRGKPAIIFFMAYWCGTCHLIENQPIINSPIT